MATEQRLVDAKKAYEIARSSGRHDDFGKCMADLTSLKELLEDCTTVDAVEVVRCKECAFWDGDRRCNGRINGLVMEYTDRDDFCSYGERRK